MTNLKANHIDYYYLDGDQRRYILRDLNVEFNTGVFYAILGQSGSGKTTLLSLLSALDVPKAGTITLEDKTIESIGYEAYRRNKIGIIFQNYNLVPHLTAHENILLAMSITNNQLPTDANAVAYNLLDYIGITKTKADRLVTKLSGGEQQRVAIARALSTNVDIIIADEPSGNLDEAMEKEIIDIFKRLAHEHNKCVIVATHATEIAQEADVSYYLRKGILTEVEDK